MTAHRSLVPRVPALKCCGLTRAEDARLATALGASFLGFIFAESRRRLEVDAAEVLFRDLDREPPAAPRRGGTRPRRVGVFAGMDAATIAGIAERLRLDVLQLHGAHDATLVPTLRARSAARIWTVVHVGEDGAINPAQFAGAAEGDGILLDAKVDGMLGGTGRTFDWERTAKVVEPLRAGRSIILAGGLRPDNVARAIAIFAPDVVDVSSGIERAPGVKDPVLMRAFADAVGTVPR